jgi:hypothetical protein
VLIFLYDRRLQCLVRFDHNPGVKKIRPVDLLLARIAPGAFIDRYNFSFLHVIGFIRYLRQSLLM